MIDLGIAASAFIQEYNKHYRNRQIPAGATPMTIDLDALEKEVTEYPDDATCNREIIELIQRLREAEKDAERYRFIRDVPWTPLLASAIQLQMNEDWDRKIDAAIDQQRKIATGEDLNL